MIVFDLPSSYSDSGPIFITYSDKIQSVIFDGRWSFFSEWKESSLNDIGESLKIRTAHHDDYVYIFVDVLSDSTLDKDKDKATVCFDTKNSKSEFPDIDDYCFTAVLDSDIGITLQGGIDDTTEKSFVEIPNHENFIAIGAVSDKNDRYLKTPHPSYEFKIPTDVITRNNLYGFYLETFNADTGKTLSWPPNTNSSNPISSPIKWGEMISPDKSLPEFPLPMLLLTILVLTMIIVSRKLNYGRLRINIH